MTLGVTVAVDVVLAMPGAIETAMPEAVAVDVTVPPVVARLVGLRLCMATIAIAPPVLVVCEAEPEMYALIVGIACAVAVTPTSDEPVIPTVNELVDTVFRVSGKQLGVRHITGPVGVASRNFSKERIGKLGYRSSHTLEDGIRKTYPWIAAQVAESVAQGS